MLLLCDVSKHEVSTQPVEQTRHDDVEHPDINKFCTATDSTAYLAPYQPVNVAYRIGIRGVDGDRKDICPGPRGGGLTVPQTPVGKGWVTHQFVPPPTFLSGSTPLGTGVARIVVWGGGGHPATPPRLASVVQTFEAVASSWGFVSAPVVSRVMGGAQSEIKIPKNIGEITFGGGFL